VNAADVIAAARGHRGVAGIAEDHSVDLVRIVVFLVAARGAPNRGADETIGAGSAGAPRAETHMSGVAQGIEDRRQRTDGNNDSQQDGRGAERLAPSDIEAGAAECGQIALWRSRGGPGWCKFGEGGHTNIVDAPPGRAVEPVTKSATEPLPLSYTNRRNLGDQPLEGDGLQAVRQQQE
jgi:hypothetical protein